MSASEDMSAGEYVLGTLTADERSAFERVLEQDPERRKLVAFWERRLSSLFDTVPDVEAPTGLFEKILRTLDADGSGQVVLLRQLERSRVVWRRVALLTGAIAASLALYISVPLVSQQPDSQYISVVDRGGSLPPLIVRVDTAQKTILIQSVAAEIPDGRSLELWFVRDGRPPASLGIMNAALTTRSLPSDIGLADLSNAAFAVTVEPTGGSPTGGPTGPVVYTGKLIPAPAATSRH